MKTQSELLQQATEYINWVPFLEEIDVLFDASYMTNNCPVCNAPRMNVNSEITWWECGSGTDACGDGCCGSWFYNQCKQESGA